MDAKRPELPAMRSIPLKQKDGMKRHKSARMKTFSAFAFLHLNIIFSQEPEAKYDVSFQIQQDMVQDTMWQTACARRRP